MEAVKRKIRGFEDWDTRKKGRALLLLTKQEYRDLFADLEDDLLRAAIDKALSAGVCISFLSNKS